MPVIFLGPAFKRQANAPSVSHKGPKLRGGRPDDREMHPPRFENGLELVQRRRLPTWRVSPGARY